MSVRVCAVSLAFVPWLAACTQLNVRPYSATDVRSHAGYAYMLDFTQFDVTLTRTLAECEPGSVPVMKVEAAVTPRLAPDGDQVYVIDPASLISAFKTSDISVDYKDGRLVGFNASTVDKTSDVIASVVSSAGKIATMAVGIPVAGGPGYQFCSVDAVRNLQFVTQNKDALATMTGDLEEANARLALLTTAYAAKPSAEGRRRIEALTANIKVAREQQDALTKKLAKAQDFLVDKMTVTWPDESTTFDSAPLYPLSQARMEQWFQPLGQIADQLKSQPEFGPPVDDSTGTLRLRIAGPTGAAARLGISADEFRARYPNLSDTADWTKCVAGPCATQRAALETALATIPLERLNDPVSFHIVRRGSYGGQQSSVVSRDPRAGLRYRVPAAGLLFVCEGDEHCFEPGREAVAKVESPVAQLGAIFTIPFSSPAFASGSVSAKFDDQGRLLQAGLKRDSSTALGTATSVGQAVDQLSTVLKAAEGAPITEAENATKLAKARKDLADAEAALVKTPQQSAAEELALLDTQKKIADLRAAMGPDQAADLTKQVQIAKLEADLADQQKRQLADPTADLDAVKAQYEARAAVLNAQRTSIESEVALIAAQRQLDAVRTSP